jgi:RNA polymerase sigma-70 factor, ECF subfamily
VPSASSEDAEVRLIGRVLGGEPGLFPQLIEPYRRSMFLTARSIVHDPADAEEVTQESTLKAFAHLGELRSGVSFRAWLLQIVWNEARMRLRKDRKHLYESLEGDEDDDLAWRVGEPRDPRELPSDVLARKETRRAITEALGTLSEPYREVFLLRDVQHRSVEDTAQTLGISTAAVKTRLHRARLQMREKLHLTSDPGAEAGAAYRGKLTGMAGGVQYAVSAECPRAIVWETLTDWKIWPLWERIRGLYTNVYWKSGEPWQPGSRFVFEHCIHVGPISFTFDARMLVTSSTPPQQITWINHGIGVTVHQTTELVEAEGRTTISTSAEFLGKLFQATPIPVDAVRMLCGFITNFYDALAEESCHRFSRVAPRADA